MRQSVESWLFVEFVRLQIDDDGGIDEAAGPARAALEDFLSARSVHDVSSDYNHSSYKYLI